MWLSRTHRPAIALLATIALTGCAFQPLYGERGGVAGASQETSQVEITISDTRLGQTIRNELIFLLGSANSDPAYDLRVSPSASEAALFSNTLGQVTSYSYRLNVSWELVSQATGEVLTAGRSQSAASYNRTDQPFANIRAQRDAEERAAKLIAENISTRVAAYFATLQPTGTQ